jgi:hypothetical protein
MSEQRCHENHHWLKAKEEKEKTDTSIVVIGYMDSGQVHQGDPPLLALWFTGVVRSTKGPLKNLGRRLRREKAPSGMLGLGKAEHGHGIPAPVNISLGKSETRKCMWRSLISAPGHRDFITMLFQAHGRTTVLSWLLWLVWVNLKLLSLRIAYILGLYT